MNASARPALDIQSADWICRDCLNSGTGQSPERCPKCGKPRILSHPELNTLCIAHIDCDAFYAAIEKRDDPTLESKPVIVGGGRRGVVSTCCYIARISGVRSAMPMFQALKLCPNAVVIKPRMDHYAAIGRTIREMMLELTPIVEPLSIDEAFLDLSGTERVHKSSPASSLVKFAKRVETELGLSVSVGLSHTKSMAKLGSEHQKPRGFTVIGKAETLDFLAPLDVSALFGVGAVTASRLRKAGYNTLSDLQKADIKTLAKKFGDQGLRLKKLSIGEDPRPVKRERARKSVSSERTFHDDIRSTEELRAKTRAACERVSAQLKDKHLAGRVVTLKLKTASFRTITKRHSLHRPTQSADRMFRVADELLKPFTDGTPYRLLGVGISDLSDAVQADDYDLADALAARRSKAEQAIDSLRDKFGQDAVAVGLLYADAQRSHSAGKKAVKSTNLPRNEKLP